MKRDNLLPPTYFLFSISVVVLLGLFLPWMRIIPAQWNIIGITLLITGVIFNIAADNAFRLMGTTIKPFEESTSLVTSGLYGFTRNPMYLGFVLMLTGLALLIGRLTPFFVIPIFIVLLERRFIVHEERMLATKFGVVWQEYASRTRRWI
jgi:protein-S-isoprenylcysteine O-methyltransferase Ste14